MVINPPEIIRCPACKYEQLRLTLLSGNTIGAIYYSDGNMDAPMLPRYLVFVRCPKCGVFFKVKKENVVGEAGYRDERPQAKFLTIKENIQAINDGLFNGGNEGGEEWKNDMIGLRAELWWAFNVRLRRESMHTDMLWRSEHEKIEYTDNCR